MRACPVIASLLLAIPLVSTCAARGGEGAATEPAGEGRFRDAIAFRVLARTNTVASLHVSDSGARSIESVAFRRLLARPDAAAAFEALLGEATLAGQLHGLCGLYLVAPDRFAAAVGRYRGRAETVDTLVGCISFAKPAGELVERVGAVLVGPPPLSAADWDRVVRAGFHELDIAGGGLPAYLAGRTPEAVPPAGVAARVVALASAPSSDDFPAILALGPGAAAAVVPLASHGAAEVRRAALQLLCGWAGEAAVAATVAVKALRDPDPQVRDAALWGLARLGPWGSGAGLPALWSLLDDPDASAADVSERIFALRALVHGLRYSAAPGAELPEYVRAVAPDASESGSDGGGPCDLELVALPPGAVTALARSLVEAPSEAERANAAFSLARAGRLALPGLVAGLQDSAPRVRRSVLESLDALGAPARAALPALRVLLADPDPATRTLAAEVVERLERSGD